MVPYKYGYGRTVVDCLEIRPPTKTPIDCIETDTTYAIEVVEQTTAYAYNLEKELLIKVVYKPIIKIFPILVKSRLCHEAQTIFPNVGGRYPSMDEGGYLIIEGIPKIVMMGNDFPLNNAIRANRDNGPRSDMLLASKGRYSNIYELRIQTLSDKGRLDCLFLMQSKNKFMYPTLDDDVNRLNNRIPVICLFWYLGFFNLEEICDFIAPLNEAYSHEIRQLIRNFYYNSWYLKNRVKEYKWPTNHEEVLFLIATMILLPSYRESHTHEEIIKQTAYLMDTFVLNINVSKKAKARKLGITIRDNLLLLLDPSKESVRKDETLIRYKTYANFLDSINKTIIPKKVTKKITKVFEKYLERNDADFANFENELKGINFNGVGLEMSNYIRNELNSSESTVGKVCDNYENKSLGDNISKQNMSLIRTIDRAASKKVWLIKQTHQSEYPTRCSVQQPENKNIGEHCQFSNYVRLSLANDNLKYINELKALGSFSEDYDPNIVPYEVLVDNLPIGYVYNDDELHNYVYSKKMAKREGKEPIDVTFVLTDTRLNVMVYGGRHMQPYVPFKEIFDEGKIDEFKSVLECLRDKIRHDGNLITWDYLIQKGFIEWIDGMGKWSMLINNGPIIQRTHLTLPGYNYGIIGSGYPYIHHVKGVRAAYDSNQTKNAGSDKSGSESHTFKGTNIEVTLLKYSKYMIKGPIEAHRNRIHLNVVHYYEGESQEDAIQVSSRFRDCTPTIATHTIEFNMSDMSELNCKHVNDNVYFEKDGMPPLGTQITQYSELFEAYTFDGKARHIKYNEYDLAGTDMQVIAFIGKKRVIGTQRKEIILHTFHYPTPGDKFASGAQKSIVAIVTDYHNMPIAKSGWVADIIFNPKSMKKRETWGYVLSGIIERYLGNQGTRLFVDESYNLIDNIHEDYYLKSFIGKDGSEILEKLVVMTVPYTTQQHFAVRKAYARNPAMPYNNLNATPGGKRQMGGLSMGSMDYSKHFAAGCASLAQNYNTIDAGKDIKYHSTKDHLSSGYREKTSRVVLRKKEIFADELREIPINPYLVRMIYPALYHLGIVIEEYEDIKDYVTTKSLKRLAVNDEPEPKIKVAKKN
ncbi:hypothetical protein GEMRC1_000102 [Eukaryota sp. GEM-RC1]